MARQAVLKREIVAGCSSRAEQVRLASIYVVGTTTVNHLRAPAPGQRGRHYISAQAFLCDQVIDRRIIRVPTPTESFPSPQRTNILHQNCA